MQTHTSVILCVCVFFSTSSSSQNWPKYVVHFRLPRKIVVISRQYTVHNAQRTRKKKERKKGTEREEGSLNSFILHAHCPVINGIVSVIFPTASIHPTRQFQICKMYDWCVLQYAYIVCIIKIDLGGIVTIFWWNDPWSIRNMDLYYQKRQAKEYLFKDRLAQVKSANDITFRPHTN